MGIPSGDAFRYRRRCRRYRDMGRLPRNKPPKTGVDLSARAMVNDDVGFDAARVSASGSIAKKKRSAGWHSIRSFANHGCF
jgi:hypothetical protein